MREIPTNVQKLTDYINRQENPKRFMGVLLALCAPSNGKIVTDIFVHNSKSNLPESDKV